MPSNNFRLNIYSPLTTVGHVLGFVGTAATQLLKVLSDTSTVRFQITSGGDVMAGDGSTELATTATQGFQFVRGGNGVPTGTPANAANGYVPLYYDRANDNLYAYNGSWVKVTLS